MSYKSPLKITIGNIPYLGFFLINITINTLIVFAILYFQKTNIPPLVPLLYGGPAGESQLVPRIFLIIPNIIALSVNIFNLVLVKIIKDEFLKQVFAGLSITATVLATITVANIIFLVGSF